jgi:hypothetical protein
MVTVWAFGGVRANWRALRYGFTEPETESGKVADDCTRAKIADILDELAAQNVWNSDLWQQCYDLVAAHANEDELVAWVHDDVIHYSGKRLLRSAPIAQDFTTYREEFRNVAKALRTGMSVEEYKEHYE